MGKENPWGQRASGRGEVAPGLHAQKDAPAKPGHLTVVVKNKADGKVLSGAEIKVDGSTSSKGTSHASGTADFPSLKPENYKVEVKAKYFEVGKSQSNVAAGATTKITIELTPLPKVKPLVSPDTQNVVVKRPYTTPSRRKMVLKTDRAFDGTGKLTRSSNAIRFFTAAGGGTEIKFDGKDNSFTGAQLSAGTLAVYAEGSKASANVNDFRLTLTLEGGTNPADKPFEAKMTSIEVTLDICHKRPSGGGAPAPLDQPPDPAPAAAAAKDKLYGGRFVHVQDAGKSQPRAMLIIHKAKPSDFAGDLELTATNGDVELLDAEDPAAGAIKASPHAVANAAIPAAGLKLWVQGKSVSAAIRSTGYRLGVKGLESDGDRISATAVKMKISVKVPVTNSARGTFVVAAPFPHHLFSSDSGTKDLTKNVPTVLARNSDTIELEATLSPAGLPDFKWKVEPNPGPAAPLPAINPAALKAKLASDASGGYAVCASVGDAAVHWNLVLVDLKVLSSKVMRNGGNLVDKSGAGSLSVSSGAFNVGAPATCGMYSKAKIKLTAGGQASLDKYCDKVHVGIVNVLQLTDAQANYSAGGRERERIPSVAGLPNPVVSAATVVTDLGYPILDRGDVVATRATGGSTIFLSSTREVPANGVSRLVETCDSPAVGFDAILPVAPPAGGGGGPPPPPPPPQRCTSNSGVNDFLIFLTAYSDDANYSYVVFGKSNWKVNYSGAVVTPAGGMPTPAWTRGGTAGITGVGTKFEAIVKGKEAKAAGCEVRPPVYLTYILDAR